MMDQRRQHTRLALESRHAVVVATEGFGKKFDGNTAAEFRIGGLIHISHATRNQMARDLVVGEFGSNHDLIKICGQILSNDRKSLTYLRLAQERVRGRLYSWRETAISENGELVEPDYFVEQRRGQQANRTWLSSGSKTVVWGRHYRTRSV